MKLIVSIEINDGHLNLNTSNVYLSSGQKQPIRPKKRKKKQQLKIIQCIGNELETSTKSEKIHTTKLSAMTLLGNTVHLTQYKRVQADFF